MPRVAFICAECGTTVWRPQSSLSPSPNRFCSRSCRARFYPDRTKSIERWKATELDRFWAKIRRGAPEECWEWIACRDRLGYGQVSWRGRPRLAHRIALSLTDGLWDSRLHVCHSCDNPACCNPAHLWRGTQLDNLQDCKGKGRSVGQRIRGEAAPQSKTTKDAVLAIRKSDLSLRKLAALHGISATQVRMIKKRAYWRHVQ